MSQLNVKCSWGFSDQVLLVGPWNLDTSLDLSLPPGFGQGAEDQCVHHEH